MILTFGLAALTVVIALSLVSAGPATRRSRSRSATRRSAFVRAHPRHANSGDILGALAREGIGPERARATIDTAGACGISLATLWQWIDRHGDGALGMVAETEEIHAAARPDPTRSDPARTTTPNVELTRSSATRQPSEAPTPQGQPGHPDDLEDDFEDDFADDPAVDGPADWPAPSGSKRIRVRLTDNVSRDGGRPSAA